MLDVARVHHVTDGCISSLALGMNFVLLYLILRRSSPQMKRYKGVLLLTCVSDISLSSIVLLVQPAILPKDGYVMVVSNGWLADRYPLMDHVGIAVFCSLLHANIVLIVVQFLYRFRLVCSAEKAPKSNAKLFVLAALWCVAQALDSAWCFVAGSSEETREIGLEILHDIGWTYNRSAPPYPTITHWSEIRTKIHHFIYLISTFGGYSLIILSHYKIMKYLKQRRHLMSASTRRMHNELTRVLSALAMAPLLTSTGPSATIILLMTLRLSPGSIVGFITVGTSLITLINPMTTMYFVRPYRRAIVNAFRMPVPNGTVTPRIYSIREKTSTDKEALPARN